MGQHRQEDKDKKRSVGEERRVITPEERQKAIDPKPKPDKPGRGRHRR